MYIDESLQEGSVSSRYPFRKRFGASRAAIGALVLIAIQHDLVDKSVLQDTLKNKFGDEGLQLVRLANELAKAAKETADVPSG